MTTTLAVTLALLATAPVAARDAIPMLPFAELLEPTGDALRPTTRAAALAGRRVRLDGFMARMEDSPRGGFWLVPRPLACDESGGGTGDLPPEAVFVVVRSAARRAIAFRPGALSVTGVLELGPRADADGRVSSIRVVLDRPHAATRSPSQRSPRNSEVHP